MTLKVNDVIPLFPDLFAHVVGVAEDKAIEFFVDATLRKVTNLLSGAWEKRREAAADAGDELKMQLESERIRNTVASLSAEVERLTQEARWDWRSAEREVSEPGFEQFIDDAFATSAASRADSKPFMLGRLIAHRLQVESDSREEALLRRALRAVRDLTEQQMLVLGATALLQRLPDPNERFPSRDAAEACLRDAYSAVLTRIACSAHWDDDDFETLASIGATRMEVSPSPNGLNFGDSAGPIDQWLSIVGVDPYDQLTEDAGSAAWRARFAARFPTIVALHRLEDGVPGTAHATGDDSAPHRRLRDLVLTPLGATIGAVVLDQLSFHVRVSQ